MNFYKNDEKDQIWMVDTLGSKGEFLFSFDKKSIFNFFTDYPDKLSDEQICSAQSELGLFYKS